MPLQVQDPGALQIQACLANANEIHKASRRRVMAAEARSKLTGLLPATHGGLPETCSICFKDLHLTQASETNNFVVVLPDCLHSFHVACLGNWCVERCMTGLNCPLCPARVQDFEEMLLARVRLQGPTSVAGRVNNALNESVLQYLSQMVSPQSMAEVVAEMARSFTVSAGLP